MDVETFVMLATGRAIADSLVARVNYVGDVEHGRKVTGALNMMI